jgi:hypothetical protein
VQCNFIEGVLEHGKGEQQRERRRQLQVTPNNAEQLDKIVVTTSGNSRKYLPEERDLHTKIIGSSPPRGMHVHYYLGYVCHGELLAMT